MSERRHIEPIEDYTKPFLVSFGVLIFTVLWGIWALFGLMAMLFCSWVFERSIVVVGRVAEARRYERGPKRWR